MNKIMGIGVVWIVVIGVYVMLAILMPAINEISGAAATELIATSNMSNYPGTLETVQSSPWWLWAVPSVAGIITTAVMLKRGER